MTDRHSGERESGLVAIRSFGDELEANLGKSALQAAGIDCIISRDNCGGMEPQLSLVQGIKLLVRSDDAQRAAAILADEAPASR
jgi:hypothetical protein